MWNISAIGQHDDMMQDVREKLNPGLPQQKWHSKRGLFFTSILKLKLRKKVVKCYIWSTALYSAQTRTLSKVDQKYLGSFEVMVAEKDGEDHLDLLCEK